MNIKKLQLAFEIFGQAEHALTQVLREQLTPGLKVEYSHGNRDRWGRVHAVRDDGQIIFIKPQGDQQVISPKRLLLR